MNTDIIDSNFNKLESDTTLQNLIAQANARYILYNTSELEVNFPRYTIKDDKLNLLAFQYLNLGCQYFENKQFKQASVSLEKGASILEFIHGSPNANSTFKKYYGLTSALAYYVSFQYSKSFILIGKVENDTIISKLISLFLNRKFSALLNEINQIVISPEYTDDFLSENYKESDLTIKIYEFTIAKALNNFVKFFYTGDLNLLNTAKDNLTYLREIAEIRSEPDIWWIIRLLLLILEGFRESSLWSVLGKYFNINEKLPSNYIQSLVYKGSGNITELFITQRNSLPTVLNEEQNGSVVSVPTSSGKTRIGEIAILDCLSKNPDAKILFIAPFRSLAYEIENSLDEIFNNLGVSVSHLYGGSLFSKLDEKIIDESSVIVATPEKAKALLRSNQDILSDIKLVIVDEGHLLGANKRLIVNEMFYEELRYFVAINKGKFLLLSAVLPNAEDLAQWLTSSSENVFRENWRPSDERIGILEWNGNSVNLNWQSTDTERKSFNPRFILSKELPRMPKQRRTRHFPENKNQAVAATAYKLRTFGPVLIFVGVKKSVFTLAREYVKCISSDDTDFVFKNESNWRAFELACIESYGADSEWLVFARMGIFCHNADLLSDVRLPLERLMRSEKPRVIIATSTLGQGVNLGVSTVIFSTLYQASELISSRDFWNIAGRAGRAFVDHEGKILVAMDSVGKDSDRKEWEENIILNFFDKNKIDKAKSGCLELIRALKRLASNNDLSFDKLIELIAENRFVEIHEQSEDIDNSLDWIDDGLLALHNSNADTNDNISWVETYFVNSLAYIQAKYYEDISGEEVVKFIGARIKGIVKKVGVEKEKWLSVVASGIPINSDLQIEAKLVDIIEFIHKYSLLDASIENKIILLENIENLINEINALKEDYLTSVDSHLIRSKWLNAVSLSEISSLVNATEIITKHYSFNLPWILNGISKKLKQKGNIEESDIIEELAILVELGLPNIKSVKVYQAGIRSRTSAKEIAELFDDELWEKSIKYYKNELIERADYYKEQISDIGSSWIDLLVRFSKRESTKVKRISNFTFGDIHEKTQRLIARLINEEQYLMSTDFCVIEKISNIPGIDFSKVNELNGIYFDYDNEGKVWKMICVNPYLKMN